MTFCLVAPGLRCRLLTSSLVNHSHWLQALTWLSPAAPLARASQRGRAARGAKSRTASMTRVTASFALSDGRHDSAGADAVTVTRNCQSKSASSSARSSSGPGQLELPQSAVERSGHLLRVQKQQRPKRGDFRFKQARLDGSWVNATMRGRGVTCALWLSQLPSLAWR